jgi:transposase
VGDLLRTNYFPKSHMPDEGTREKRLLTKERVTYGTKQAELKNSIKWMLKRRGIEVRKPLSIQGREQLRSLHLAEIDRRLRELELVESIVDELDGRIRAVASTDAKAKLLDTIPGLGPYTALFLSSSLDDVSRFADSKQACAYIGLVPSLHQSGDVSYTGHITRLGNKWLRRNLVECARWSVRKDPHIKEFFLRIMHKKGKKKAYVAVARKLVAYAYWLLKRNVTYQELAPWKNDRGQSSNFE